MAVVLILIFGLIIRGVLSIQSNTSTDERVASEDIAFDIVAETPRIQGDTDEKNSIRKDSQIARARQCLKM